MTSTSLQRPRLVLGASLALFVALALLGVLPYLALGWNALLPLASALGGGQPALAETTAETTRAR